jgi:acetyl esterase/lipase
MEDFKDIQYIADGSKAHQFDLYVPPAARDRADPASPSPLICFVHGGAWRA